MANPLRKEIIYSDMKTNLSTHPLTNDLALATNEVAVNQAIKNLIMSNFGERPFEPGIGSGLPYLLFELFSSTTTSDLKYAVRECITNHEPRVEVLRVDVIPDEDNNLYKVYVDYRLKSNMTPYTLKLSISRLA